MSISKGTFKQLHPASIFINALLSLAISLVMVMAARQFYHAIPTQGEKIPFPIHWDFVLIGLGVVGLLLFASAMLALWLPHKTRPAAHRLIEARRRLGRYRWLLIVPIAAAPAILHLYSPFGFLLTGGFIRLFSITLAVWLAAVLITQDSEKLIQINSVYMAFLLVGSIFYLGKEFVNVSNYPFSLGWSEGNRLYDYSMHLGQDRYTSSEEIKIIWDAPGRYLLWGILFALPNTPIWLHRLWDAVLATAPYLLFGLMLARWGKQSTLKTWGFALWIMLFLAQGPIYTPLVLSAILVVLLVRPQNMWLSLLAAALAGYYAASSRWTWLPAAATWAALILIFAYEIRSEDGRLRNFTRLIPLGLVSIAGLAGGALANDTLFSPSRITTHGGLNHPLLWYRLLPNDTYAPGLLLALLAAVGPLTALMLWLFFSKRRRINWLQALAGAGALLAFLAMGLVASVKIGGGNNLHNLDMLLITFALLAGLLLRGQGAQEVQLGENQVQRRQAHAQLGRALLALTILGPVWLAVAGGAPLDLPPEETVHKALRSIGIQVAEYQQAGEVLFIDQRQLLTFGYLQGVPLVQDYEKKYIMNQAMEGDAAYFEKFYRDLAAGRFSLLVSETLFTANKDVTTFGDENDAWVKWVANPVLCYYKPIKRYPEMNIQLLKPREEPQNCPDYAIID